MTPEISTTPANTITRAPSTPARTGRSFTGHDTRGPQRRPGYRAEAVDRNTLLWAMVVFFGASLMFSTIRDASDEDGLGVSLAAQVAAGVLLVAFIALIMRPRR